MSDTTSEVAGMDDPALHRELARELRLPASFSSQRLLAEVRKHAEWYRDHECATTRADEANLDHARSSSS